MSISVSITTYPVGVGERTTTVMMPAAPNVGDTVHVGDDYPALSITHVSWVYEEDRNLWHVECSAN